MPLLSETDSSGNVTNVQNDKNSYFTEQLQVLGSF